LGVFFYIYKKTNMPTFTPDDLRGAGTQGGSFNDVKTFTFTNPGNLAYFTIEQVQDSTNNIKRNSDGSMPYEAVDYTEGTFDSFITGISENMIVQNKYKFSIIIPRGTNTVRYSPVDTSRGGLLRYRGTGNFTLSF
jgi:hypothetical protein